MEGLNIWYDKEGDVLDVIMGNPKPALMREVKNDIFLRVDNKTQKIVGFMILHFEKKFSGKLPKLPVKAEFALA